MKIKRYRYQDPEPGDTGGTGTGPELPNDTPTAPDAPLANHPEPAAPAAAPVDPPSGKPALQADNASKIDALLDNIGKEPAEPVAAVKPAPPTQDPAKPSAQSADPKPMDLTPPEGITERAKTRWTELAERAKAVPDLERRATEAESALTGVRELVAQSGLQQDEFQSMLAMSKLFKSSSPQELHQAMQQLDGLRADLAIRLGVDAPGIDILAQHPDLAKEVEEMGMSREWALELAKLRNVAAQHTQSVDGQREADQFQKTIKQAATEMEADLEKLANSPGHQAKIDHIKTYFADQKKLNDFVTTYQPNQWKAVVRMMYDSFSPPGAPAPTPQATQPLRPGHVSAGVRQPGNKPVSSQDAVEAAWGAIGM